VSAAKILINDSARRAEMGVYARKLVESRFNLEQELDAYSKVYGQMI